MDNTRLLPHTSAEERATGAFFKVMESAPMGLLISAALGLAIVGVFQFIFYFQVIPNDWPSTLRSVLSVSLALFFEGLGFYFLVTTVRDFSGNARKEGWIGLGATFLLWGYALWEATHIASAFDSDTVESFWSILGIIGTIICVVRVVELRITLTVTSSVKRKSERAEAEAAIKLLEESNEKMFLELRAFRTKQAEQEAAQKQAEELQRKQTEELLRLQAEAADAEQRKLFEEAQEEMQQLRRKLDRVEKKDSATGVAVGKVSREIIQRKAAEYIRKNGITPTQETVAALTNVTAKSIRNHFPNGSWGQFISSIQAEVLQS